MAGVNIEESLFDAISALVNQRITQADFNQTTEGKIVELPPVAGAPYTVSVSGTKMPAHPLYQDIKYNLEDEVYILVLNGSYSNTKVILGKKPSSNVYNVAVENVGKNYIQVSEDFIIDDSEYGITANDPAQEERILFEKVIGGNFLNNYTRLKLEGMFRTNFGSNPPVSGEYGLRLDFLTEEFTMDYQSIYFKNSQMYGNVYGLELGQKQSLVCDISSIKNILKIRVVLYQDASDKKFLQKNGKEYPYKDSVGAIAPSNIFVKNLALSFGYDLSEVKEGEDRIELFSENSGTYSSKDLSEKTVNLSWVHWDGAVAKEMAQNNGTQKLEYCFIRWYKYTIRENLENQETDNFLNKNWEYQGDNYSSSFEFSFKPRVNAANEQIRAIILYSVTGDEEERLKLESPIIKFENSNETILANQENTGAKIIVQDGDKNGKYYYYGVDNYIPSGVTSLVNPLHKGSLVFSLYQNNKMNILTDEDKENVVWTYPGPEENTMLTNIETEGNVLKYNIKDYYSSMATNNVVKADIRKDDQNFHAEFSFEFGTAALTGADANIVPIFLDENNNQIYAVTDGDEKVRVKLRLYDSSNQEVNVDDYEIWYYIGGKNNLEYKNITDENIKLTEAEISQEVNYTILEFPFQEKFNLFASSIQYLWLKLTNSVNGHKLELKKDIPVKAKDKDISYIEGTTTLQYSPLGVNTTTPRPFKAFNKNGQQITDISWMINSETGGVETQFGKLDENGILTPLSYYDDNIEEFCIRAYREKENNKLDIFWKQPITKSKNLYSSATINKWDGSTVTINNEDGSILAPMLVGGHKSKEGLFTGVTIGDYDGVLYSDQGKVENQTGIYGFNEGEVNFSFVENGTATIGKSSGAQLKFDGNESTIQSAGYKAAKSGIEGANGLKIDFFGEKEGEGPYIEALVQGKNGVIEKGNLYQFKINASAYDLGKWIPNSSGTQSSESTELGSAPVALSIGYEQEWEDENGKHKIPPAFTVDWAGNMTATSGTFTGEINARNGEIGEGSNVIKLNQDGYLFYTKHFKINKDGTVEQSGVMTGSGSVIQEDGESVTIAGWKIEDGKLKGGTAIVPKEVADDEENEADNDDTGVEPDENTEIPVDGDPGEDEDINLSTVNIELDGTTGEIKGNALYTQGYYIGNNILKSRRRTNDYLYWKNHKSKKPKGAFSIDTSTKNSASFYAGRHRNFRITKGGNVYIYRVPSKWRLNTGTSNEVKGGSLYVSGNIYCLGSDNKYHKIN